MKTRVEMIRICHICSNRDRGKCRDDAIDVVRHAQDAYCSLGKYRLGLGDTIASFFYAIGLRPILRWMASDIAACNMTWRSDTAPDGCGCMQRQLTLNELSGPLRGA